MSGFLRLSSLFAMTDEQAMWRVQTQDDHRAFALVVDRWRERIRIGPTTTEALEEFAIHPAMEPSHPKMGLLVREALA